MDGAALQNTLRTDGEVLLLSEQIVYDNKERPKSTLKTYAVRGSVDKIPHLMRLLADRTEEDGGNVNDLGLSSPSVGMINVVATTESLYVRD